MADKKNKEVREVRTLTLPTETVAAVPKTYTPEGFKTQELYLADMRENYNLDIEADDDNRQAAMEDKKFTAGEQWDPLVLQQRQGLPCLSINTVPQFTAQLVGDWRENKNGIKVLPAESGDKNIADIRSDLIRAIETQSRANRIYDSCFESMVQCGDGAFRVAVQYAGDEVFDQEIVLNPIDDALSVVWDRLSVDPTGRDATRCWVDDLIPRKEFEEIWPEADPSDLNTKDYNTLSTSGWINSGSVRISEHWRMIERKKTLILFKDGTVYSFEGNEHPDDIDAHIQKHGQPVKTRIAPCLYAQMHLVTGFKILAGPFEWKLNRLPIVRMSGRTVTIGDRRVRFGLVRFIKDAVRLRNFQRSVAAEQLGYAPKAQWLATESAIEGREEAFRNAHLTRDPLLIANDEAILGQNLQRIEPPQIQEALLNEAQTNTQDIKDITGIHDASLGIKSNETSGKAIMARQREGDVASLSYYDNGNAALLEAGDVINQLIPQIYDATRIVRIIGEDESVKMVNINDPSDPASPNLATGKYDVALTSGVSYTTRRVEAAQAMMDAIQVYPEMMQIAGDIVVKAQDWPGAEELSERLLKTVPPALLSDKEKQAMGPQGPDMQALMQQQAQSGEQLQAAMAELQKLQQENESLKVKADIEHQKNKIAEYKAETERLTAYAAIIKDGAAMNIQQLEQAADRAMAEEGAEHSRNMDVANLLQEHVHTQQGRDDQAQAQDRDLKAKQALSSQKASTQPSK